MINDLLRNAIYYAEAFWKRPLWTAIPAGVVLVIATIVIFSLPRSYSSDALLIIESPQSSTSLVPSTVANEQLKFVEQRVLARENLLKLASKYDLFPGPRQSMSDTMFAQLVRNHITIFTMAAEPSDRFAATSSMRIAFRYESATQAAAVTEELVRMIESENRGLRIQRASEMARFLDKEARELAERLAAREKEWQSYLQTKAEAMPGRAQSLDNEVQEKERELSTSLQAIATLDQEMQLLEAQLRLGTQQPGNSARDREQLTAMEAELATKSTIYSEEHPAIRALTQRIASLKERMAQATRSAADPSARELTPELALISERITIGRQRLKELEARRAETAKRITDLRTIIADAPSVQARLEGITREREGMQRSLDDMRGRLSTARTSERLERGNATANVQIIERPEVPRYPISPGRTKLMVMALAGAIACGLGGLYLGDSMQRSIRGTFDLEGALAGSTLVVVPRWSTDDEKRSVVDVVLDRLAKAVPRERPTAA